MVEAGEDIAPVVGLLQLVAGDGTRPGRYLTRHIGGIPHTRDCRIGQWVDGYHGPSGAPCSKACVEARIVVLAALAWIEARIAAEAV